MFLHHFYYSVHNIVTNAISLLFFPNTVAFNVGVNPSSYWALNCDETTARIDKDRFKYFLYLLVTCKQGLKGIKALLKYHFAL